MNNNLKWLKWIGSLLGKWWIVFTIFLFGSFITGAGFVLVGLVVLSAAVVLAATDFDTFKRAYDYSIGYVKNWWQQRPGYMDKSPRPPQDPPVDAFKEGELNEHKKDQV